MNNNKSIRPNTNVIPLQFSKGKWLRCNKKKKPIDKWRHVKKPSSTTQLTEHIRSDGNVGIVPGSLDLVVFDIDIASCAKHDLTPREALDELMLDYQRPLFWYKTPSGGIHAGYPYKGRRNSGQVKWKHGDIISGNGCYFVVWSLRKFAKRYKNALTITDKSIAELIDRKIQKSKRWDEGNRNNTLNAVVYQAVLLGRKSRIKAYEREARDSGLSKREICRTIKSARKAAKKERRKLAKRQLFGTSVTAFESLIEMMGYDFRYNVRTARTEWKLSGGEWLQLNDRGESAFRESIAVNYVMPKGNGEAPWRLPDTRWRSLFEAYLHDRDVDPFRVWLAGLPRKESQLLKTWLHELFIFDAPQALVEDAARLIVGSIVQRTYAPGCEIRQSVLLVGETKAGKTQLTRSLVPQTSLQGKINFKDNSQKRLESITGERPWLKWQNSKACHRAIVRI